MSDIHLLLQNWRERKIYKKIPLGLLRWFLKASFSTFWVKFGNTIQKFRFSFDPI